PPLTRTPPRGIVPPRMGARRGRDSGRQGGAMAAWRILGSLVVVLGGAATAQAQTYALKEDPLAGISCRLKLHLTLAGELKVRQEGKVVPLKQTAAADH